MEIKGRKTLEQLMVTGLGKEQIILGFPWLTDHNPDINWKTGRFSWREPTKRRFFDLPMQKKNENPPRRFFKLPPWKQDKVFPKPSVEEIPDEEKNKNRTQNPALDDDMELGSTYLDKEKFDIWLNTKTTTSNEFHLQHDEKRQISLSRNRYHQNTTNTWMFLMNRKRTDSLVQEFGITKSK